MARARRGASAREGYEHVPVPEARIAPPVRRIDELPVAEVLTSPSGATILDFGQNLVGRLRITVDGPAGTRLTLRHAEVLEDGELSLRPLRNATATDVLELAGDGPVTWEPRFTFHGFRYASIDGWPGEFDPADVDRRRARERPAPHGMVRVVARRCSTGCTRTWSGACAATSSRSRPTARSATSASAGRATSRSSRRPRASSPTATAFLTSWLRDLAHEQRRAHGVVPLVVPAALPSFGIGGPTAAWGDAATIVPWVLYERFGDLGRAARRVPEHARLGRRGPRGRRAPGLWAGRMQLGDWLDPDAPPDKPGKAKVDGDVVASAYLARSLRHRRRCGRAARRDGRRRALRDAGRAQPARRSSPST